MDDCCRKCKIPLSLDNQTGYCSEHQPDANGMIKCPYCAELIQVEAIKCKHCGEFLDGSHKINALSKPIKSRSIAILLAIFLGSFGFHKFYLGKPGVGIFYLIFCWTFIPLVISLVEAISYLALSDNEFQRRYEMDKLSHIGKL